MAWVIVTGAGRGIGLEFARQYRAAGSDVIATCRSGAAAAALAAIGCKAVQVEMTDSEALDRFVASVPAQSIDIAVLNAGTAGHRAGVLEPATRDDFDDVMRTNVFGPMRLIARLADRMVKGGRIAVLSSRMGSLAITDNGRSALYRASKAALNIVSRAASFELASRGVIVVVLSPGWVKTDMGGAGADLDAATSVEGMRRAIAATSQADSGRFVDHAGAAIPW